MKINHINSINNTKLRKVTILSTGLVFALGVSACGSSSAPTNKAKTKAEAHTIDIVERNLNGVDTQISLSSTAKALLANQHGSMAAVAPASVNYASTSSTSQIQSISLPITSGNFVFDKTDHHLTGIIDHSGGFRITMGSKPAISITDMSINLTTHQALATINGTPNLPIFSLTGTADIAQQGVHNIISGLSLNVSANSPAEIKSALGQTNNSIGTITITATSAK